MCTENKKSKVFVIINAICTAISTIIGALFLHSCIAG